MDIVSEGRHDAEWLLSEANGYRSRTTGVLASGQSLEAGAVVGKFTANGKFTALNPGRGDGSEAAAGILYAGVDASAGDRPCVVVDMDAEANARTVVWPAGIKAPQQTQAETQLLALGIKLRPGMTRG